MMQTNAALENQSMCVYCEPTRGMLVGKLVAGIILTWIELTSSGRMSVTTGMPTVVYILSPSAARSLHEVPPTADMTLGPDLTPLHTSLNSLNFG